MNYQLSCTMTHPRKQIPGIARILSTLLRPRLVALVHVAACAILLASAQRAAAFATIGSLEFWMIPAHGFNPLPGDPLPVGPKNIGEEYRRNMPVYIYSFDQTFLDYFGSNGVSAVEQAFSFFNSISNVSSYSAQLDEWPLECQRFNYQAQALGLTDLKSITMHHILENMGLTEPERYMWVIHNRVHSTGAGVPPCPDAMIYLISKRNYDPVFSTLDQLVTSSYVNGTLYSYAIYDLCANPPALPPISDAAEFPVDNEANVFNAVGSGAGPDVGGFFLGLTRDDVGGLRYLLRTNNMNIENAGPGTVQFVTNTTAQLLVGSNLNLFASQALTNDPATLATLYPGLIITSSSNFWGPIFATNITAFLTNGPPWAPPGSLTIAFATNRVFAGIQTFWIHHFANTFEIQNIDGNFVSVPMPTIPTNRVQRLVRQTSTVVVTNFPGPFRTNNFTVVTNTTSIVTTRRGPVGEFFIAPSNSCDVQFAGVVFTDIVRTTNIVVTSTNVTVGFTNALGATNIFNGQVISNSIAVVDFFTNHYFAVFSVDCPPNPVGLYQGIERISFVRQDFDSIFGRFFQPQTNTYILNEVTNGVIKPRVVQRVITQPDFLFNAADLDPGPATIPFLVPIIQRNINLNSANNLPGLAGPGTIEPNNTFTFNKGLPLYENTRDDPSRFLDELGQSLYAAYGSFDGTTNPPIVYPNGTSITNLENAIFLEILPSALPSSRVDADYQQQLTVPNGQAPLTFSIVSGSLPAGLTMTAAGAISGNPALIGTFQFVVRMTDARGRASQRLYTLVILP
jgi:hypothetical protein